MKNKESSYGGIAVILLAILCCFLWGSITPVIKVSYQHFGLSSQDTPSLMVFAGIRYILCGLLGICFGTVTRRRFLAPKASSFAMIVKLAIVQTFAQQLAFYISLTHISGVNASILGSLNNFFSILVACLIFHQESLTVRKLVGCALGFLGVITINLTPGGMASQISMAGEGMLLVSCITCGASYAMIKQYSPYEDVLVLNSYQFLLGGIGLLVVGFLCGGTVHTSDWVGLLLFAYMVAMPITAFTIWGTLLKYRDVSQLSVFGFVSPITGVVLSAIFLSESGSISLWRCAVSLALVSLGIYVVNTGHGQLCKQG